MRHIIEHTRFPRQLREIQKLVRNSRSKDLREMVASYVRLILGTWPAASMEREIASLESLVSVRYCPINTRVGWSGNLEDRFLAVLRVSTIQPLEGVVRNAAKCSYLRHAYVPTKICLGILKKNLISVCKSQKTEFCSASRTKTRAKRHGLIRDSVRPTQGYRKHVCDSLVRSPSIVLRTYFFSSLLIFLSEKTSGISLAVGPIGVPSQSNHPRQVVYCRCYHCIVYSFPSSTPPSSPRPPLDPRPSLPGVRLASP